jgi:hypothetical protein
MLELLSKQAALRLMSFPVAKKVAFLLLLYERMRPATYFYLAEGLAFSVFEEAREKFWRSLIQGAPPLSWVRLRDDIHDAIPDGEDFGSLEASFAMNAALVAGDIAGLLDDGQDSHIVEAMQYVSNSIDAYVMEQLGVVVFDSSFSKLIDKFVNAHPARAKRKAKGRRGCRLP